MDTDYHIIPSVWMENTERHAHRVLSRIDTFFCCCLFSFQFLQIFAQSLNLTERKEKKKNCKWNFGDISEADKTGLSIKHIWTPRSHCTHALFISVLQFSHFHSPNSRFEWMRDLVEENSSKKKKQKQEEENRTEQLQTDQKLVSIQLSIST